MSRPKAYDPQLGYRFQILCRNPACSREWEHCDYAENRKERNQLIQDCSVAYGPGWEFKTILQPSRYWPKKLLVA